MKRSVIEVIDRASCPRIALRSIRATRLVSQYKKIKPKHWRGVQDENASNAAPVLDFCFLENTAAAQRLTANQ
jgi:hypothetical protein